MGKNYGRQIDPNLKQQTAIIARLERVFLYLRNDMRIVLY